MAVRRKLDRVGLKVGLEQWKALDPGERLAICHLPADSREECEALETFVRGAVRRQSGAEPKALNPEQRTAADPPTEAPAQLVENARMAGISLGSYEWSRLDDDQRYALIKLGGGGTPSHNLRAALEEFLGRDGRSGLSKSF
jgi:hypothetical protein